MLNKFTPSKQKHGYHGLLKRPYKTVQQKYNNTENYIKQGLILKTVLVKDPRLKEYIW